MDNSGAWVRGYVLHLRPYRGQRYRGNPDPEHGRIGAVVRGLKKKRPNQSLQPFQCYVLTWRGQRELVNLVRGLMTGGWFAGTALSARCTSTSFS